MNHDLAARVAAWITADPDAADRATLTELLDTGDEGELSRRFAAPLTFGTAGLRGPVMAGPAGMNRLTVRRATQGVVGWLQEIGSDAARGVVIGRDARHGSEAFNDEAVSVLVGAGVRVHEMPRPLPTPLVAFAVKDLGAAAGIMITASHNPPNDNGYKLYAADGAQIIPPNDEIVERRASHALPPALGDRSSPLHHVIPEGLLSRYRDHLAQRFGVAGGSDLAVTYTPLFGVGGEIMTELFAQAGYRNVSVVASQFQPDPTFPGLAFPNPEEPGVLDEALAHAASVSSSLVIANDPDADRLAVAVPGPHGWRALRGDEVGWLLGSTLLQGEGGDTVATTIVSSTMLEAMATEASVRYVTTLTGFKWIARAAGDGVLRFGYEEALGYAVDPFVADKDGMSAALCVCRLAHELAERGQSLVDRLDELERRFGVHGGGQLAIRAEGPAALTRITEAVARLRSSPPVALAGLAVTGVVDLAEGWNGLAPTDGVILFLGGDGRVVVRPSGTEPKLKCYIEVTPRGGSALDDGRREASARVGAIREELSELLRLEP